MPITFEQKDGVLYVAGRLDRTGDDELRSSLERYIKSASSQFCVDMSNVRWLTPTGAKVLIQIGQDVQDAGKRLRVIASRHVNQTLNLLGAKTWLQIENAAIPSSLGGSLVENLESQPEPMSPASISLTSTPSPAVTGAESVEVSHPPQDVTPHRDQQSAHTSHSHSGTLAGPAEHLEGGAHILKVLVANRRYSFRCSGGDDIIGVIRERVGGSWILVESQNSRKILNLDMVQYCEIL